VAVGGECGIVTAEVGATVRNDMGECDTISFVALVICDVFRWLKKRKGLQPSFSALVVVVVGHMIKHRHCDIEIFPPHSEGVFSVSGLLSPN
jgi:hypothetical protein